MNQSEQAAQAEHIPIGVDVARQIAERFRKSAVVILAYDPESGMLHTTTFGAHAAAKLVAAKWGDRCNQLIAGAGFELRTSYEDFRDADPARQAERIDTLLRACRAAEHAIGSLLAVRDGISDELLANVRDELAAAIAGSANETGVPSDEED